MLRGGRVALLAAGGNTCLVFVKRQRRIRLMRIQIAPAILMAIGTVDRLGGIAAVDGCRQLIHVNRCRQDLARG
jgi:hypothetical protein